MEVRDVFELRKQGKIEEAYNAIRPMYAAHKGHYTTIAMFWIAHFCRVNASTDKGWGN